jgi:protocatechuate 3,4-dioxygenase beta subunit
MKNAVDRREVIKKAGLFGAGIFASATILNQAANAATKTPSQPQGPFYPVQDQVDKDADMTVVSGSAQEAEGEKFVLSGTLVDATSGFPLSGALVEFWQACASGKYNHPQDSSTAPLDQNFQYWAQVLTTSEGKFTVKTIVPGAYPAGGGWIRPPHIHVKVHKAGYPSLTTQLYFEGNRYNAADRLLQSIPQNQHNLVIVRLEGEGDVKTAAWTIYMSKFLGVSESGRPLSTPDLE